MKNCTKVPKILLIAGALLLIAQAQASSVDDQSLK